MPCKRAAKGLACALLPLLPDDPMPENNAANGLTGGAAAGVPVADGCCCWANICAKAANGFAAGALLLAVEAVEAVLLELVEEDDVEAEDAEDVEAEVDAEVEDSDVGVAESVDSVDIDAAGAAAGAPKPDKAFIIADMSGMAALLPELPLVPPLPINPCIIAFIVAGLENICRAMGLFANICWVTAIICCITAGLLNICCTIGFCIICAINCGFIIAAIGLPLPPMPDIIAANGSAAGAAVPLLPLAVEPLVPLIPLINAANGLAALAAWLPEAAGAAAGAPHGLGKGAALGIAGVAGAAAVGVAAVPVGGAFGFKALAAASIIGS